MTILGFIRHGTTEWNVAGRLQGQNDIPLNEAGRRQAYALGERLLSERWDCVVSSDLARAKETADIIAGIAGLGPVRLERSLRERTHGRLDGTTQAERVAAWGDDWHLLDHGVESNADLYARGAGYLDELAAGQAGKRILVVTHGAFIAVLLNGMLARMPEGSIQNTSLTVVEKKPEGWECVLFNCTDHLVQSQR
ncbi:histidine phosphatase family protein [Paenibacillus hodogayensis]|uniref:Histidine phosphatase family protein n=1 Tax=Paenibacillus hodogayensis TaxID=279208 RepID=A0ABV5W5N2_9BACL